MQIFPKVTDRRGGRGTDYRVDDSDVDGSGGRGDRQRFGASWQGVVFD